MAFTLTSGIHIGLFCSRHKNLARHLLYFIFCISIYLHDLVTDLKQCCCGCHRAFNQQCPQLLEPTTPQQWCYGCHRAFGPTMSKLLAPTTPQRWCYGCHRALDQQCPKLLESTTPQQWCYGCHRALDQQCPKLLATLTTPQQWCYGCHRALDQQCLDGCNSKCLTHGFTQKDIELVPLTLKNGWNMHRTQHTSSALESSKNHKLKLGSTQLLQILQTLFLQYSRFVYVQPKNRCAPTLACLLEVADPRNTLTTIWHDISHQANKQLYK